MSSSDLPKLQNQLTKNANFWVSKWFFYVKNYPNLSKKFFHWRISILGHIFCHWHFWKFHFLKHFVTKIILNFWQCRITSIYKTQNFPWSPSREIITPRKVVFLAVKFELCTYELFIRSNIGFLEFSNQFVLKKK